MADQPGESCQAAAQGQRSLVAGPDRMIDQPAASAVTPAAILAPHRERTRRRMVSCRTVLMIQDGSDLNFAPHPKCGGNLGLISRNAKSSGTLGLHMHSTLAVDADTGIPLGVTGIEYDAPDDRAEKGKLLEERKSARWLRGLRDTAAVVPKGVHAVAVLDREADFFALFAERRKLGSVDLLVRAKVHRSLGKDEAKLFGQLAAEPVAGFLKIPAARPFARHSAREAAGSLRFRRFDLPDPGCTEASIPMTAVSVTEDDPPAGVKPLQWILLTSLSVTTKKEAERILDLYRLRGRIKDWHRVLKGGCKAEFLNHHEGEQVERAVTTNAVIAWRLLAMVMRGRETPELPAEVLFSETALLALQDFAVDRQLDFRPDNLGNAVRTMAILGGHLDRRSDPPPGSTFIWRGYTQLDTMTQAYERLLEMGPASGLYQLWFRGKTCVE